MQVRQTRAQVVLLPADCQAPQQLVAQGLGLGNGAQAAVIDLLSIQLDALGGGS